MMTSVTGRRLRIRQRDIFFPTCLFLIKPMDELPLLDESTVERNPLPLFSRWYDEAAAAGLPDPNAMALATVGPDGKPSARIVLLRGFDERGFAFFTNYDSRKGAELAANPHAAL